MPYRALARGIRRRDRLKPNPGVSRIGLLALICLLISSCASESVDERIASVERQIDKLAITRDSAVNDLITRCMKEQGFSDFVQKQAESWTEPPLTTPDGSVAEGLQRAEIHGFGIASGHLSRFESSDVPAWVSGEPNNSQVETESPEETEALWSLATMDGETIHGGCNEWANMEWESTHPEWNAATEFRRELASYMEEADGDPRIRSLDQAFVGCMRKEGYQLAEPEDALRLVRERIEAIPQEVAQDQSAYVEELRQIRRFEVELATAAWHCDNGSQAEAREAGYEGVYQEYRERFARENPDLFAPFDG